MISENQGPSETHSEKDEKDINSKIDSTLISTEISIGNLKKIFVKIHSQEIKRRLSNEEKDKLFVLFQ
jgi:hypothetical protein